MIARLHHVVALVVIGLPLLPMLALGAELSLKYDVYYGPLRVVAIESRSQQADGRFKMSTHMQTVGMIGSLFPWTLQAEARGLMADGDVRSESRVVDSVYRGKRQHFEVRYSTDGAVDVGFDPAPDTRERELVPVELRRDTLDPDAALIHMLGVLVTGGTCSGTLRIFDGRLRYDLQLAEAGKAQVATADGSIYSGPTRLCDAVVEPIAGFPLAERVKGDERARLRYYLAPVLGGATLIPARVDLSGPRGTLKAYLVDAQRGG